jgi:DNA-3-methyladenine glycosylase
MKAKAYQRLPRKFFLRPTLEVARDLLGKLLVLRYGDGQELIGEINEVEAYIGRDDPACHAAVGRTKRNEVMFWRGGHAYVYFTYGMYHCLNVITEEKGFPAAVLIRSLIPRRGLRAMKARRHALRNHGKNGSEAKECGKTKDAAKLTSQNICNGPGKLCLALGLNLKQNGIDLVKSEDFFLADQGKTVRRPRVATRIGISKGTDLPWRFFYGKSRPRRRSPGLTVAKKAGIRK